MIIKSIESAHADTVLKLLKSTIHQYKNDFSSKTILNKNNHVNLLYSP